MVSVFSRKEIPSASFAQEKESYTSLFLLKMRDSIWLSNSAKTPAGVTALSGDDDLETSRSCPFHQAINHPAAAACPPAGSGELREGVRNPGRAASWHPVGPGLHCGVPTARPPQQRVPGQLRARIPCPAGFHTRGDSDGCLHQSCNLVAITTGRILCSLGTPRLVYNVRRLL